MHRSLIKVVKLCWYRFMHICSLTCIALNISTMSFPSPIDHHYFLLLHHHHRHHHHHQVFGCLKKVPAKTGARVQEQQEPESTVQAKNLSDSHFKKLYGRKNSDQSACTLLQHEVLLLCVQRKLDLQYGYGFILIRSSDTQT